MTFSTSDYSAQGMRHGQVHYLNLTVIEEMPYCVLLMKEFRKLIYLAKAGKVWKNMPIGMF